jgi:acetyl esterase/lipase
MTRTPQARLSRNLARTGRWLGRVFCLTAGACTGGASPDASQSAGGVDAAAVMTVDGTAALGASGERSLDAGGPGADAAGVDAAGAGGGGADAAGAVVAADAAGPGATPMDASRLSDSSPEAAPVPVTPPVTDTTSTLGISAPGGSYTVEGNLPYGPFAMQRLDVIYPAGAGPKGTMTLPGVIMFHGGGWTDNKPAALKASMSSFFDRFLAHGFLVCNVEYRLADGTANGAIAPAAVQDALLAAQWFWDHMDYYHVDKTRYVVTGGSAGGHLALMVGMATPAARLGPTSPNDYKIAAIVNGYGPSDVTDLLARNVSWAVQWLPANTPNRAAIAQEVSPVTYVRKDIPPLITVQGMNDTTVPTAESQNLYNLLTAAGAVTALHFVAGAGHGFSTPATAWPDAEAAMFSFLAAQGI